MHISYYVRLGFDRVVPEHLTNSGNSRVVMRKLVKNSDHWKLKGVLNANLSSKSVQLNKGYTVLVY